jgi:RNA polymerase sigma-70 factor (ECF subfamily)
MNVPQRTGDKVTLALEKYSDMVYRICLMYLKSKAEAEDAFQDVFLRFMQANKQFESEEHEKGWLCTVAFNRCKDILKSAHYRLVGLEDIPEPSYENKYDKTVLEAVLALPAKYKDVIYLHYYEGYTAAQIAKILRCRENTIYSQLSRARGLLKERLGDEYEY